MEVDGVGQQGDVDHGALGELELGIVERLSIIEHREGVKARGHPADGEIALFVAEGNGFGFTLLQELHLAVGLRLAGSDLDDATFHPHGVRLGLLRVTR